MKRLILSLGFVAALALVVANQQSVLAGESSVAGQKPVGPDPGATPAPPKITPEQRAHARALAVAKLLVAEGKRVTDAACQGKAKVATGYLDDLQKRLEDAVWDEAQRSPEVQSANADARQAADAAQGTPYGSEARTKANALGLKVYDLRKKRIESLKQAAIAEVEASLKSACPPTRAAEQPPAKPQIPAPGAEPAPPQKTANRCRTRDEEAQIVTYQDEINRVDREYTRVSAMPGHDPVELRKLNDQSAALEKKKYELLNLDPCPDPPRASVPPPNEHGMVPRNCPASGGQLASNCEQAQRDGDTEPTFSVGRNGEPNIDTPRRDSPSPPVDIPGVPSSAVPFGALGFPGGIGPNGRP